MSRRYAAEHARVRSTHEHGDVDRLQEAGKPGRVIG